MRASLLPLALGLALSTACRQQIVVYECPDGSHPDAAPTADGGVPDPDGGAPPDGGDAVDAGVADTGASADAGGCEPFCLRGVTASADVIDVREVVTLTPDVEAAPGVQWTVQIEAGDLTPERAPGRPAVVPAEVPTDLSAMGASAVAFRVLDVPPWFFETTYAITVRVQEVGTAFSQSAVVRVTVRGNVIFSTGQDGLVYAVASDGNPATGGGAHADGVLIDRLVVEPRQLRVLQDGTLLVFDSGASPERLVRFEMTGADVLAGELQFRDAQDMPLLRSDASLAYGMTQLADGRVVLPEYAFSGPSGAPKSRLVVWGTDGRFERELFAPSADEEWRAVATTPDGELLIAENDDDVIDTVDPSLWQYEGRFIDALPASPYTVEPTADALYIGGFGYVLQVPWAGGRATVSGLDSSSAIYRAVTEYTEGRVLIANDRSSRTGNIALVDGRSFVRWFRADGGPTTSISGLAYLR